MYPAPAGQAAPEKTPLVSPPVPANYQGAHRVYYYQPPTEAVVLDRPRNARRRRFWHLFVCAFLAVVALHLLLHSHWLRFVQRKLGFAGDDVLIPAHPTACSEEASWTPTYPDRSHTRYPYHAHTSFELPVDVAELFFLTEGPLAVGSFEVSQSTDVGTDKAVVDVDVHYYRQDLLDETTVCSRHPADDDWGLGIFTPEWPHRGRRQEDLLNFEIHVKLPAAKGNAPLKLNSFRTSMKLFAHYLGALANSAYFDKISLSTSNMPIRVESLSGNIVTFHTSNGPISGEFKVLTSLDLVTSNSPITARADLVNGNEETPTELTMRTQNGHIEGTLTLISNLTSSTNGSFLVDAHTINSPLDLNVVSMPLNGHLSAVGRTSNGRASAFLHEAFEGTFDLSTSTFFRPTVEARPVTDPSGQGRTRRRLHHGARGTAQGYVAWEQGGEEKGKIELSTSNAPVQLTL